MKLLYEAQNSVEAYMILNLVEQAGLSGRVDGEYLQGGVGELQAFGVVRVMIDEGDYLAAREIIQEWDSSQPALEPDVPVEKKSNIGSAIAGFVVGAISMAVYFHTPVSCGGVDYQHDGVMDTVYEYDLLEKVEAARKK